MEKVAKFLGKNYTTTEYESLKEHLKFDNFKNNTAVNLRYLKDIHVLKEHNFVRSGKSGGWREYFDEELNERADKWIQENLKDTDIVFPEGFFN